MEKVTRYKCSDGAEFKNPEEGQKHEDQLTLAKEVDDFLNASVSQTAGHTKSAKRDLLIPLWPILRDHFTHKPDHESTAAMPTAEEVGEGE